jgi:hypothetical protein
VEKEQIHSIPSVSNTQSALPTNKSEIAAKFQRNVSSFVMRADSRSVSEYSSFKARNSRKTERILQALSGECRDKQGKKSASGTSLPARTPVQIEPEDRLTGAQ